jgi:diadenosine tetraphosphate (Ap4A) HIT family hydrolase
VTTDTKGRAEVNFNDSFTRAGFKLVINLGRGVTQAHIHCAPRGQNGPIVLFLAGFHDRGWNVNGEWIDNANLTPNNILDTSCGTTLAQIAQAMADGRMYVNAHTLAHPGGEVRGQLRPDIP